MAELVPMKYLSLHEARDVIVRSLFAGMPDQPHVIKLREQGIDATDGSAIDEANAGLWQSVDDGKVEAFAIGLNGQLLRIEGSLTEQVPLLRNPRGGDFTNHARERQRTPSWLRGLAPTWAVSTWPFASRM